MPIPNHLSDTLPSNYGGRILTGNFSAALKARLADYIARYQAFEDTGNPVFLYIAAWQGNQKQIWYEYISRRFAALLGCDVGDAAQVFRKRVIDRRIYKYMDVDVGITKEVSSREELSGAWEQLRDEGQQTGNIEAVYKISVEQGTPLWLKDQAMIEAFVHDGIYLSPGLLTVVSKEMEAEDELKRHHDQLEAIVQARTAELTQLNQQLQQEIEERKLAEVKLQHSYDKLQQNLDEIVTAISLTVEERDPYTAGHQKRTTELALALAGALGLSEDRMQGMRMAGLLHDIGKISIPAEILSKPGRLNEAEIQLIRRHPQIAFDILSGIDFPWPVDRIVLQHHEKIDGSGYPLGLSGDEMLTEAKILCVADVVETIASHRPYRPGLGLDQALEEISHNRGRLYDAEVVDVCLKLFREKRFKFQSQRQFVRRPINGQ